MQSNLASALFTFGSSEVKKTGNGKRFESSQTEKESVVVEARLYQKGDQYNFKNPPPKESVPMTWLKQCKRTLKVIKSLGPMLWNPRQSLYNEKKGKQEILVSKQWFFIMLFIMQITWIFKPSPWICLWLGRTRLKRFRFWHCKYVLGYSVMLKSNTILWLSKNLVWTVTLCVWIYGSFFGFR